MKKKNKIILWIVFVLTILTLTVIFIFDYNVKIKRFSAKAKAIITEVRSSRIKTWHCAYYEFEVDKQKYYGKYYSFKKHKIGEFLDIKYNPNEPEINFEEKADDDSSVYLILPIFFSFFIFAFEFLYIQSKLVFKKKLEFEEKKIILEKIYKIIKRISFLLLTLNVLILCYSTNHYVISSIKIFMGCLLLESFIPLGVYSSIIKTINKVKNNSELLREIKESKAINCEFLSVYFTKERLIVIGYRLKFINYSDMLLVRISYVGDNNNTCNIYLMTKNFKKHKVASVSTNNSKCCIEIMKELKKRVPNILEGYTKENMEKIKEMKMNKKNL